MDFEWDSRNAKENQRKHAVSFSEAATIFGDALSITVPDPDHSLDEFRFLTDGLSEHRRFLIVSHTERDDKIRIIIARELTRSERKTYEAHR